MVSIKFQEERSGAQLVIRETAEAELDIVGLVISPQLQGDGLCGSKFIECLDYSMGSCGISVCAQVSVMPVCTPVGGTSPLLSGADTSLAESPRPAARGLGSFVRRLSQRNPKRNFSMSPVRGMMEIKREPLSRSVGATQSNLRRRRSNKTRHSSALMLELGKERESIESGNVMSAPSSTLSFVNPPLASSSTSTSSSVVSPVPKSRKLKKASPPGVPQRPKFERSRSTNQIFHLHRHIQGEDADQSFEVLNRSSFRRRSVNPDRDHHFIVMSRAQSPTFSVVECKSLDVEVMRSPEEDDGAGYMKSGSRDQRPDHRHQLRLAWWND